MDLRANTAIDVLIGPFVDSTDGNTTEDGLTLSQADIKLSKNGQALTQKTDATAAAFDDDGYYNCELDATDTNTEGNLVLIVHETGALPVRHEYNVLSEAAFDSLYVAKDDGFMDVNIKTIGRTDTQETEANNLESACSNYSVTRGLTGTALPGATADGVGGVPISDAGGLDIDTKLANTNEITASRMGALTDWINGGRLDAILDIIAADVVNLDGAAMRGTDSANTTVPDAAGVAPTAIEIRQEIDTNSTKTGYALSTAGILAIWHQALTAVVTAGSVGKLLKDEITSARMAILTDWIDGGRLDLILDAIPTTAMRGTDGANTTVPDAAGVVPTAIENRQEMDSNSTQLAAIVADTNELQTDDVPGLIAALNDLSSANVLTQVNAALDTAISELGVAAPTATPTLRTGLMLVYMALRNKLDITASTKEVHNNAGTKIAEKTLSDNGTTYTESEMS